MSSIPMSLTPRACAPDDDQLIKQLMYPQFMYPQLMYPQPSDAMELAAAMGAPRRLCS